MIKHGVVMVTLLILTLNFVGAVSASDVTASDVEVQSLNQETVQIKSVEGMELSLSDVSVDEGNGKLSSGDKVISSCGKELEYSSYSLFEQTDENLINDLNYELDYNATASANKLIGFESADDIFVITTADSDIGDVTVKNTLNGIIDASNGLITYEKGNLLTLSSLKSDLIDIAFFIKKCESLTMAFYKNGAITSLCSGDESSEISVDLWNEIKNSLIDGDVKGVNFDESHRHFSSEQLFEYNIQPLLGCNNLGESLMGTDRYLLGVPIDSDENTVICPYYSSDNDVCISVDSIVNENVIGLSMKENTSENGMIAVMSYDQSNNNEMLKIDEKLNPENNNAGDSKYKASAKLTSDDLKQIGVDAANKAFNYYKSLGINVKKDYENFYILTSAGYAKINGINTKRAIEGLLEVFGPEMNKNIDLIHIPLWKDLIFYFIWVKDAENYDFISYSLKYYQTTGNLVESEITKLQGDLYVYQLELFSKSEDDNPVYKHVSYGASNSIDSSDIVVNKCSLTNNTNTTDNSANVTNATNTSIKNDNLPKKEMPTGGVNPFNIVYTLISIFLVCAIFSVSYSKR